MLIKNVMINLISIFPFFFLSRPQSRTLNISLLSSSASTTLVTTLPSSSAVSAPCLVSDYIKTAHPVFC